MPLRHRLDAAHHNGGPAALVGLLVGARCRQIGAALVEAGDLASPRPPAIGHFRTIDVPEETSSLFAQLSVAPSWPLASFIQLRAELTELAASLVGELLAGVTIDGNRVLAVGVHDPGLWMVGQGGVANGCLGLCDPARLAELTSLNVVDDFPARDLAQRGQGGPLLAIPEWLLLADERRTRLLADLGQTFRLTYLPPGRRLQSASQLLSFDVGPGMRLLDLLTQRLSGGSQPFDAGGRLAVQGRRIAPLIEHWLRDPYFERSVPRWHPRGVRPERFLTDAVQMAIKEGWSVRDLLCSATHFVAETVALAVRKRLPPEVAVDDVVATGGGQHNGMLLHEIGLRLPGSKMVAIGDLGIHAPAFGPACVALLAAMHLKRIPGNSAAITGAEVPRVLGRLTPGAPQCWQRLLRHFVDKPPSSLPLRANL